MFCIIFFDWKTDQDCMIYTWEVDTAPCCLHSREIPTSTLWERNIRKCRLCKCSSAFGVVRSLLILSPDTMLLWERSRHDHTERAQYFKGVVFYLPFGFIDQPLALDEMLHCDFDSAVERPCLGSLISYALNSFLKVGLKLRLKFWDGLVFPLPL